MESAGIVGFANGSFVSRCSNSGTVTCVNKGGGILGHGSWDTVS